MPRPATWDEYDQLVADGVLINLGGEPLRREPCTWCNGTTVGETCPLSIDCPACGADGGGKAGHWCMRPSGHRAMNLHKQRIERADSIDHQRELEGDPTLPAPWPKESDGRT